MLKSAWLANKMRSPFLTASLVNLVQTQSENCRTVEQNAFSFAVSLGLFLSFCRITHLFPFSPFHLLYYVGYNGHTSSSPSCRESRD